MIWLLDINILIALYDPAHSHYNAACRFFEDHAARDGWATCPLTENGFLRILGSPVILAVLARRSWRACS